MAAPHISIVVPLYNKRGTISRALESIGAQTMADHEVIVVDDGSTDGSSDIVAKWPDPRVRLLSQPNAGPGAARNRGAEVARADTIAFLDADDAWRPCYLEISSTMLETHTECAAIVCGYDAGAFRDVRPNKVLSLVGMPGSVRPSLDADGYRLKMFIDAMHSSCVVVRRDAFMSAGGFFERHGCRYGEDSWLWARIFLSSPIFWEPAELVRFHVEDSDIGFATTHRVTARPVSLYPAELSAGMPLEMATAAMRLASAYAAMDYAILKSSGAWAAARRLRKQHHLGGWTAPFREICQKLLRMIPARTVN